MDPSRSNFFTLCFAKKKRRSKGLKTPRSRSSSATAVERSDWIWRTRRVTTGRGAAIRPRSGTGSRSVLLPVEKAKQAGGDQNQDHHGPAYRRHYCTASLSLSPGPGLQPPPCVLPPSVPVVSVTQTGTQQQHAAAAAAGRRI